VLSAYGMLLADVVKDYSTSLMVPTASLNMEVIQQRLGMLTERALEELHGEDFGPAEITLAASIALRYRGEAFELDVPLPKEVTGSTMNSLKNDFHERHAVLYGYSSPQRETEAVQVRLRAMGRTYKPERSSNQVMAEHPLPTPVKVSHVVFDRTTVQTPVYHRNQLSPGMGGQGPTVIISGESTNILPPGWKWHVDRTGTIVADFVPISMRRSSRAH